VSTPTFNAFDRALLDFLGELGRNNNRDWFQEHKHRYDAQVLEPALQFIAAMETPLRRLSPHFRAIAKRTGGSLMRVYRDTRFGRDKRPYKTNVGIQFRHEAGRDVHAPGFYVHIAPGEYFLAAGSWHPEPQALTRYRDRILEKPSEWRRARNDRKFNSVFTLQGDSLKRPPRGFDPGHPLIQDLKRKDFIAVCDFDETELFDTGFPKLVEDRFAASRPLMRFLCRALELPF